MPYLGRSMSVNAARARENGLLPLSSITARVLSDNNFAYPKVFFQWLCRRGYISPSEFHHASASKRLYRYYDTKLISIIAKTYNLDDLYSLYQGKTTKEEIYRSRQVKYVRVVISGNRIGVNRNIYLDCIQIDGLVLWSKDTAIDMKQSKVLECYGSNMPTEWKNPNAKKILRKVIMFKRINVKYYR